MQPRQTWQPARAEHRSTLGHGGSSSSYATADALPAWNTPVSRPSPLLTGAIGPSCCVGDEDLLAAIRAVDDSPVEVTAPSDLTPPSDVAPRTTLATLAGRFDFLGPPVKDELATDKAAFDVSEHQRFLLEVQAATAASAATPSQGDLSVLPHGDADSSRPAAYADTVPFFRAATACRTPQQLNATAQNTRRSLDAKHAKDGGTAAPRATPVPKSKADAAGLAAAAKAALEGLTPQQCNARRQNARRAELKREARDANLLAEPDTPQPPTAPKRLLGAVAELWERKKARTQLPN